VNIAAVDNPDFTTQLIPAVIFQIMDASYKDDEGLWSIVVNKRTAKPTLYEWAVPNADGAYVIIEYTNQTSAWLQHMFSSLSPATRNECFRPPHHNEFNLFEGNIHIRPSNSSGDYLNQSGTEVLIQEVHDAYGNVWEIEYDANYRQYHDHAA